MNNPNPFVPKGSLLEQQSQRRSRLKFAVFCVLAVSVTGLVAMLIQGCKREQPETPPVDTNAPVLDMPSNQPPVLDTNALPPPQPPSTNAMNLPPMQPPVQPPVQPPAPPVQPQAPEMGGGTYTVVQGDTLAKIAKAHGISVKALEAANPGVDPKKLKVKQTLNLPASSSSASGSSDATSGVSAGAVAGGGESYTVKSGDTLSKIAKKHGLSVRALRAANPKLASTDHIKVGEKLTIPGKSESAPPPAAPAPDTTAMPMTPAPTPAPTPTPAPAAPGH
jgi:LysM repeat protein